MTVETLLNKAFGVAHEYELSAEDVEKINATPRKIRPYGILFTARSGSTFLTHELSRTGILGTPHEWFNWDLVKLKVEESNFAPPEYISDVIVQQSSQNGIFGFEINWLQLVALTNIVNPMRLFDERIVWFFLRRRNLVAQAISHFLADQSKVFHSYQVDGDTMQKIKSVEYNADAIKRHVANLCSQEVRIASWLLENKIGPINIYYEDLISRTAESVFLFSNALQVEVPEHYRFDMKLNPMKKISSDMNVDFEARIRESEGEFLNGILRKRPAVLVEAPAI